MTSFSGGYHGNLNVRRSFVFFMASIAFCRQNGKMRLLGDTPNYPDAARRKEEGVKQRKEKVTVRLTHSEKEHLEKQAWLAGMGMEPFIRSLIAGSNLRERPPEYWRGLIQQLSAIGNNINQIAHNSNIAQSVSNAELEETLALMREVWKLVKEV